MSWCREPTEREAERFLELVRAGVQPPQAAREAWDPACGEILTSSAFKRLARTWDSFGEKYAEAQAIRKANRVTFIEDKLEENVERAMQAAPVMDAKGQPTGEWKWDGAVANRSLELLGRTVGMFGGGDQQIEVTVGGQVTVTHERRLTLADLADYVGTLDGPRDGDRQLVPDAAPVLAEPAPRELAAGGDAS